MIVDVTIQIPIDTSEFKKNSTNTEKFCEELAESRVKLALKNSDLSKCKFTCKARKEVEKIFEGKFIKDIIVHSRVEMDDVYDYYYIDVIHNKFPDADFTNYETLIKVNKRTRIAEGDIGGSYFALQSFETYKEYEKEFAILMGKLIKENNLNLVV